MFRTSGVSAGRFRTTSQAQWRKRIYYIYTSMDLLQDVTAVRIAPTLAEVYDSALVTTGAHNSARKRGHS